MAAAKVNFLYRIDQVIQTDDIALTHTYWTASGPEPIAEHPLKSRVASRTAPGDG